MSFEEELGRFHSHFLLKEFTYIRTTFSGKQKKEIEIADNIVYLDGIMLLFQIKERNSVNKVSTPEKEKKWF